MGQKYDFHKMKIEFFIKSTEELKKEVQEALTFSALLVRCLGEILKESEKEQFKNTFSEYESLNHLIGNFLFKLMDGSYNLPQFINFLEKADTHYEQYKYKNGIAFGLTNYYELFNEYQETLFKHPNLLPFKEEFIEKLEAIPCFNY
ncbi:hypothetical protein IKE_05980 [Bacillus cereus VD196]|uniref:Uncharacterized protein n=1 Tax=Bacillus cereus VD196 TaxID=1053243 RepID=A0A9W5PYD4_BACCE|nr:hypothetical protein [Bacillus cereus]EJR89805.1 hypothetical protein IKG_05975 [Bacillus cereus VD200]EOO60379.1 hypothetical protein IKE_05980 [Bacillus cereus VD196]